MWCLKGAETLTQTGHISHDQVQVDLAHAAVTFVTAACICNATSPISPTSSKYYFSVYEYLHLKVQ